MEVNTSRSGVSDRDAFENLCGSIRKNGLQPEVVRLTSHQITTMAVKTAP